MLLEGKRAIVTGGSRGIGRGISVEFARQGADVVINYFGGADRGFGGDAAVDETIAEIEALGRKAIAVEGDISDPEVSKDLVQAAIDSFGGVDILVLECRHLPVPRIPRHAASPAASRSSASI